MQDGYETFELGWGDFTINVSHQANWLSSGHWHIELRCDERLPVTETGYRSIFVPEARFVDDTEIASFVTAMLDESAQSQVWQAYYQTRRQLTLF